MHCGDQRHLGLCLGYVPALAYGSCRVSDQGTTLRASDLHNARATILNPFTLIQWGTWIMGQITATGNLVATKVVRHAGQWNSDENTFQLICQKMPPPTCANNTLLGAKYTLSWPLDPTQVVRPGALLLVIKNTSYNWLSIQLWYTESCGKL